MTDKLERARHMRGRHVRAHGDQSTNARKGKHARRSGDEQAERRPHKEQSEKACDGGGKKQTPRTIYPAGETGAIPVVASHAGIDRTALEEDDVLPLRSVEAADSLEHADRFLEEQDDGSFDRRAAGNASVGSSAALISICTIISRITGFARTWAMAFALGATFASSSYQVANNLPNMLYELVMGGLLATAFLPVYLSVKKQSGRKLSEEYASNLLTIVVVGLGAVSLLCIMFPAPVIYTQSFYSNQDEMGLAVFFFQFFAIQVVFYGASSIVSGLLNANRDYLYGAIAPVFNNLIVIATFLLYTFVAPNNQDLALYIIAVGNPLGVFVQLAIQLPGLKRNGIRLRPRINLRDPNLRETVGIGLPALFVTICSFATVSVANAASYCFADNGPSIIAYSRLWFTFPYSFLAIPVATAMFTELSDMQADGNTPGVIRGIIDGSSQIFFLMIPFALYLVVFAEPLVTLYHVGAFTDDSIAQISAYLVVMALALPFYGVNTYLQMVFSSIRKMGMFSLMTLIASLLQIGVIAAGAWAVQNGYPMRIEIVAAGTIVAYLSGDALLFAFLRRHYGSMGIGRLALSCLQGLALGLIGSAGAFAVLHGLEYLLSPLTGSVAQAFGYTVVGGIAGLALTFAPAIALKLPAAAFLNEAVAKAVRRTPRR